MMPTNNRLQVPKLARVDKQPRNTTRQRCSPAVSFWSTPLDDGACLLKPRLGSLNDGVDAREDEGATFQTGEALVSQLDEMLEVFVAGPHELEASADVAGDLALIQGPGDEVVCCVERVRHCWV